MYTRSKSRNHRLYFFISKNSVKTCFFYIENLASKRKNRLCCTASCCLCGTSGWITLNNENFTIFRVFIWTVCKFTRKWCTFKCSLPSCQISCFSCCLPCTLCKNWFFTDWLGNRRILLKEICKLLTYNAVNGTSCHSISKLLLCLSFKLRVFNLYTYYTCKSFSYIIACKCRFTVFYYFIFSCIIIECLCKCISETCKMSTTFRSLDIIYKWIYNFIVSIVMLESHFYLYIVFDTFTINNVVIKRHFTLVKIFNEFFKTAFIVKCSFLLYSLTLVF